MKIYTFDTTLRDGTQGESISFSVDDKLIIAQKLDELGIDYIEGGWPGSNPKDKEFFARAGDLKLQHARLTAFGSTRFAKNPVHEDRNVRPWSRPARRSSPSSARPGTSTSSARSASRNEENLVLISETVRYLNRSRQGSGLRRRALLRRLHRQPRLRPAHPRSRPQGRRRRALPLRHQRRHAHQPRSPKSSPRSAAASMASSASTLTTIATSPWPIPWPRSKPAPPTCRAA